MELLGIFGLLLGIAIGWYGREAYAMRVLRRLQINALQHLREIARDMITLELTERDGQIFAYNKDNGQFVSQAATKEDLIKDLSIRFPTTTFLADTSTLSSIKGKYETL